MDVNRRVEAFSELGSKLKEADLKDVIDKAVIHNSWFTEQSVVFALNSVIEEMLDLSKLNEWVSKYSIPDQKENKIVALILAGNIPAVGFHDVLSVLIFGHQAQIKLSSKDAVVIPFILDNLLEIEPRFQEQIEFVDRVHGFDAIIATGSDNTGSYFEHYFKKYPHIIRKNRKSIGIIDSSTSDDDIRAMGEDIFKFFGLGCRNISKLYVQNTVDLTRVMEIWHEQKEIILHNKYKNNYDYNYTVFLLNKENFLMNGALLLRENQSLHSRIACVHYETFNEIEDLNSKIDSERDSLQCIVYQNTAKIPECILPGTTQKPQLWQYADNVDIVQFLTSIA